MVDNIFLFHYFISLFLFTDRPTHILGICVSLSHSLGSDYRTILKSDPILLILKSELILQSHYYDSSEPILLLENRVNDLSCDYLVMVVR